jgi:hypothetical protein
MRRTTVSTLRLRTIALSAALGVTVVLGAAVLPASAAVLLPPSDMTVAGVANLPASSDTCISGYVWREATLGDRVCVTAATKSQTAYDNSQAAARRDPNSATGCIAGYVAREAYFGDATCVTPATRTQARYDNSQAPNRVAR